MSSMHNELGTLGHRLESAEREAQHRFTNMEPSANVEYARVVELNNHLESELLRQESFQDVDMS
eukprot:5162371-Amphidinium_carterae.1